MFSLLFMDTRISFCFLHSSVLSQGISQCVADFNTFRASALGRLDRYQSRGKTAMAMGQKEVPQKPLIRGKQDQNLWAPGGSLLTHSYVERLRCFWMPFKLATSKETRQFWTPAKVQDQGIFCLKPFLRNCYTEMSIKIDMRGFTSEAQAAMVLHDECWWICNAGPLVGRTWRRDFGLEGTTILFAEFWYFSIFVGTALTKDDFCISGRIWQIGRHFVYASKAVGGERLWRVDWEVPCATIRFPGDRVYVVFVSKWVCKHFGP